jgi:hypothetical protein
VTISGTGFSTVTSENIVYFGTVRAVVTSAGTNSLTVTVPVGATFSPITVNTHNLVSYSSYPFLVSFANGGSITVNSFNNPPFVINTGSNDAPTNITLGDIDGDGKNDLVVSHYSAANSGVLIYRNTSTVSAVTFETPLNFGTGSSTAAVGDLDGDGKPDLAMINGSSITTFLNTSSAGNITFTPGIVLTAGNSLTGIVLKDIDGDGKTDIIVDQFSDQVAVVYRNISEPGAISFSAKINIPVPGGGNILLTDLDGDNKPDIVVPDGFSILKNNCTKGNISFGTPIIIGGYIFPYLTDADIDGDGKTDIISADYNDSKLMLFKNISSAGVINLAAPVLYSAQIYPGDLAVSDLDGDGKADISSVLANHDISFYKSISTNGSFVLLPQVSYTAASFTGWHMLTLGDINGDGKNDAITVSESQRTISIYINNVSPEPYIQSFTPTIGPAGTTVTINGGNFNGTTAVSFGGVPASSFIINSSSAITATVGSGASGIVSVTNNYGTGIKTGFVFGRPPVITSLSSRQGLVGSSITITGNNFSPTASGNAVFFGGAKATVTAASATSLIVTVPAAAIYGPVRITVNYNTAYSAEFFSVIFPGSPTAFTASSFDARDDHYGGWGTIADLDLDGKLDLVLGGHNSGVQVVRNTSVAGTISLAPDQYFNVNDNCSKIGIGDLDGDGLLDVVAGNSNSMSVLRNTSTPGNIVLALKNTYYASNSSGGPNSIYITDVDGDGKPDIIVTSYSSRTLGVFRNISTSDSIILEERIDFGVSGYPTGIAFADLDGDNKPEMIASTTNGFSLYKNLSLPGTIIFDNLVEFPAGSWTNDIRCADFNGDGKLDILVTNINSNNISFFKNTSSGGTISFAAIQNIATGDGPNSFSKSLFNKYYFCSEKPEHRFFCDGGANSELYSIYCTQL